MLSDNSYCAWYLDLILLLFSDTPMPVPNIHYGNRLYLYKLPLLLRVLGKQLTIVKGCLCIF